MPICAKINEIFTSIQGEGLYLGSKQLFIRFCGCNLRCDYCDTEEFEIQNFEFSPKELRKYIEQFNLNSLFAISLTGGEPLLWSDFLLEFLPLCDNKIYLETNSTLPKDLEKIKDYVNVIAADIKLPSSSGVTNSFALHDEFFKVAKFYKKEIFAKVVFDNTILEDEILNCAKLANKYEIPLILQPKTDINGLTLKYDEISDIFDKFLSHHNDTRVIPQVHKFLQAP